MEINDSKNYQNYFNIISSKYLHEPNSEYKFTVQNINSIGKESVDSDEDILNQKPKKNNPKQNHPVNFIISSINDIENNQSQNEENFCEQNKNEENRVGEVNEINENLDGGNSLKENENSESNNSNEYRTGRWSKEEHEKFIEGILKHGNEWRKVQKIIKTRSSTQARSHAQKYFLKLKKEINNTDILSDSDKLLDHIISSCDKPKNSLKLTYEQKEKLMVVIRSNLKAEENLNKSEKEGLIGINYSSLLNEKDESNLDDINDEDDNLAYHKNEHQDFQKKMSLDLDLNEIKRKVTFCSRKRKSSSDISCLSNYNKIFNITKDASHKNSVDISKLNNSNNFSNNLVSKISADKNSANKIIKFSVKNDENNNNFTKNNNNYIYGKNNNFIKNDDKKNEVKEKKNIQIKNNFIINNHYIHIYTNTPNNNINNIQNVYNNQYNPNYQIVANEVMKNAKFKTSIIPNSNIKAVQNESDKKNSSNYILNNENFFPIKNNEVKQSNPFDLVFNFESNNMKTNNYYNNYYLGESNDIGQSQSECCSYIYNNY